MSRTPSVASSQPTGAKNTGKGQKGGAASSVNAASATAAANSTPSVINAAAKDSPARAESTNLPAPTSTQPVAANWAKIAAGSNKQQQPNSTASAVAAPASISAGNAANSAGNASAASQAGSTLVNSNASGHGTASSSRVASQTGQPRQPPGTTQSGGPAANQQQQTVHNRKPSAAAQPFESKNPALKDNTSSIAFGNVNEASTTSSSSSPAQPSVLSSMPNVAPTFGDFKNVAGSGATSASTPAPAPTAPISTSQNASRPSSAAPAGPKAVPANIKFDFNQFFQANPDKTSPTSSSPQPNQALNATGSGMSSRRPSFYEASPSSGNGQSVVLSPRAAAAQLNHATTPNHSYVGQQIHNMNQSRPFSPATSQTGSVPGRPGSVSHQPGAHMGNVPQGYPMYGGMHSPAFGAPGHSNYSQSNMAQGGPGSSAAGNPNGMGMSPIPHSQSMPSNINGAHAYGSGGSTPGQQGIHGRPLTGGAPLFIPGGASRAGPSPMGHQHRQSLGPNSPRAGPAPPHGQYYPGTPGTPAAYAQQQWQAQQHPPTVPYQYNMNYAYAPSGSYTHPSQAGVRPPMPAGQTSQQSLGSSTPGSPAQSLRPTLSTSTSSSTWPAGSLQNSQGGPPSEASVSSINTSGNGAASTTPSAAFRQQHLPSTPSQLHQHTPVQSGTPSTHFTAAHVAHANTFTPSMPPSGIPSGLNTGAPPFQLPAQARSPAVFAKPPSKALLIRKPPAKDAPKDKAAEKPASPAPTDSARDDQATKNVAVDAAAAVKAQADSDAKAAEDRKRAEQEAEEKRAADAKVAAAKEQEQAEQEATAKRAAESKAQQQKEQEAADKAAKEQEAAEREQAAEAERQRKADEESKAAAHAESQRAQELAAASAKSSEEMPTTPSLPLSRQASSQASTDGPSTPATPSGDLPTPTYKKPIPEPLDIAAARGVSAEAIVAPGSALSRAHRIEDLSLIPYPDQYTVDKEVKKFKAPIFALNAKAQPGKFRYDRDFLLQFMKICQEKPEQLPSLEAIGMVDEGPSAGGVPIPRSASYGGRARNPGSVPSTPLGSGRPGPGNRAVSTGFAAMGNFATGGPLSSSEARFAQANAAAASGFGLPGRPGGMARTPSVAGGIPVGGPSGRGMDRSSGRGRRRAAERPAAPSANSVLSENVQLETAENRWTPSVQASRSANQQPDDAPEVVERKIKALLNKLTVENFESIGNQILAWANKSAAEKDGRILKQVIALIFEKATDEATWSSVYAKLCLFLHAKLSPDVADYTLMLENNEPTSGGRLFRRYLLTRCQHDYERGWAQKESATLAAKGKADEDRTKKEQAEKDAEAAGVDKEQAAKGVDFSDEYYAAEKAKRRGLGLVKFIGELFKLGMLREKIMHECIKKLVANIATPEEEDIESLCRLLSTVGQQLENAEASQQGGKYMNVYFTRLAAIVENKAVPSRLQYMILDLIDTRKNGWQSKTLPSGPKSIAQIHQDAAMQARAEEAKRVASQGRGLPSRGGMERGGSRRGQGRDTTVGPDGWQATAPPRQQKAGDLASLGKIRPSSSSPAFGALRNKAPVKEEAAPGAANQFAVLEQSETTESAEPQRKKLNLTARTVDASTPEPAVAADDPEEGEVEAEGGVTDDSDSGEMDDATKRSIDNSVKEFIAVRNAEEGKATFEALPTRHRGELVKAFVAKVADGKVADRDAVAVLLKAVCAADIVPSLIMRDAFIPIVTDLEDLATDTPRAYSNIAEFMVAAGLSVEDVTTLQQVMISNEDQLEKIQKSLMDAYQAASSVSRECFNRLLAMAR